MFLARVLSPIKKPPGLGGSIFKILWLFGFCGTGTLAGEVLGWFFGPIANG
jgi:hypothetical protein